MDDTALCMSWVHAGSAQVRCGFKRQYILFAWRRDHEAQDHAALRGSRGPTHVVRDPSGAIPSGSDVAQSLCGAGPRGSTRVLEEAGGSTTESFLSRSVRHSPLCGFTRVAQKARPSQAWDHAGPAQFPRVPRTSIPSESDVPIVWRGSTRVLEEAKERV